MGRYIQLVIGPAGTGKSTYCKTIQEHCRNTKRTMFIANLDPAADSIDYETSFDIRNLITLEECMEQLGLGPNGGLVYCMEHLLENHEWLKDELDNFGDDDYIILDCPGQIELYSHLPIMHNLSKLLVMWGFRVVSVYLLDALFVLDPAKFISGCMLSLSCTLQLELPHINIVTKMDLVDKEEIENILNSESGWMVNRIHQNNNSSSSSKLHKLSEAICSIVDDYMMISFITLDITDEESIDGVLSFTDNAVQYGEDMEPKEPTDNEFDMLEEEMKDERESRLY